MKHKLIIITTTMKRKLLTILAVFTCITMAFASCEKPSTPDEGKQEQENPEDNKEPEEEVKLKAFKLSKEVTENWIFDEKPKITINIENPNSVAVTADITLKITTDLKEAVTMVTQSEEIPANTKQTLTLTTEEGLAPGFYKAHCTVNKKTAASFFFGISPYEVVSEPDMQPDFEEYWAEAKATLPEINEETVTLTELKKTSSCTIYHVAMQSAPNSPDGEPVTLQGFYVEPIEGPKPVLLHFFGWDDRGGKVSIPGGSSEYAEFYLYIRGQYLNNRAPSNADWWSLMDEETYAGYNWITYNVGNLDGFFYRGAFLDCVQAVRFMASRPTSDIDNLFAEGSSQGGALCYATAALSDYPVTGIAANVAFLGDYPDYFRIVSWPGDDVKRAATNNGMTDEEMYRFLSYFDTKNLATLVPETCAVLASSGLQDGTCPPHTNFAAFNNLKTTDKEMVIDPTMGHSYPSGWSSKYMKLFKERTK